uniref:Coat protein n=2 Tax=Potato virus X TaxID=12183 RepID=CAPSD_PVXCP|nr:RecName: Full=Coat protein; AltName: Full=Capsid protein; Short=CP [Potato virus X (strain XC)]P62406.1 RecName: Full=Coat protein; AltName: Full=Capsid protein; Short=CP [Potato virus X (strain CP)]CAA31294.1 coat protein (AA 1- 236) [Potato virus X]CAA39328.1 viral coat protein [Potato virus X]
MTTPANTTQAVGSTKSTTTTTAGATPANSGLFTIPDGDFFSTAKAVVASNAVATNEDLAKIQEIWKDKKIPSDTMAQAAWDLVRHCADVGSSAQTEMIGTGPYSNGVSRARLAAAIKEVCTLRQFCKKYAPVVWNWMLTNNSPPANWQAQGFKPEHKFAAFDFFDGVTNPAAITPKEGLMRPPSEAEMNAAQTAAFVKITKARAQSNDFASLDAAVTRGRITGTTVAEAVVSLPPP